MARLRSDCLGLPGFDAKSVAVWIRSSASSLRLVEFVRGDEPKQWEAWFFQFLIHPGSQGAHQICRYTRIQLVVLSVEDDPNAENAIAVLIEGWLDIDRDEFHVAHLLARENSNHLLDFLDVVHHGSALQTDYLSGRQK
jgi:hypothetical protein